MVRCIGRLVAASVLIAGCAGPGGSPSTAPVTATNSAGAPATTTAPPSLSPVASPVGDDWDLVWISDSTGSGGVPEAYARRIEADLGVRVRVHDAWTPLLSARNVLEKLRGKDGGILGSAGSGRVDLPALLREAEVVVVHGNAEQSPTTGHPWDWNCSPYFEESPACGTNTACGPETWEQYEADLRAIFDEIFRIREGRPVVLRTHDAYLPWGPVATWQACDQLQICAACWGAWSDAIHRAAAARGVPVAGYYAAFSGTNGDQPLPSAWTIDDVHPSKAGAGELADVMADLGYETVAPTGN